MPRHLLTLAALATFISGAFAEDAKPAPAKPYPLTTCIVSGEEFGGDMGAPVVVVREGQEVKLCCRSCVKKFDKDPAKYLAAIEAAKAKGATPAVAPAPAPAPVPAH